MATHDVTNANIITFITTDPLNVGFAAIRTANPGADQPLIDAANNAGGPGAGTVAGDTITAQALFDKVNGAEYNTMTTAQLQQLQNFLVLQNVDMGSVPTQSKLSTLFASFANSLAAIEAVYTRPAGPWEVYFGKGNLATQELLDAARNSGSGSNF